MKKHTLLKRATAAALLSATIVTPAVLGLTAGTASALPIESPNCKAIYEARESALIAANASRLQGNEKEYRYWWGTARMANANYNRHCL